MFPKTKMRLFENANLAESYFDQDAAGGNKSIFGGRKISVGKHMDLYDRFSPHCQKDQKDSSRKLDP